MSLTDSDLDLARATLNRLVVILFFFVHIEYAGDPVTHVHQHDLQRICIHSFLIGQSCIIGVVHFSLIFRPVL